MDFSATHNALLNTMYCIYSFRLLLCLFPTRLRLLLFPSLRLPLSCVESREEGKCRYTCMYICIYVCIHRLTPFSMLPFNFIQMNKTNETNTRPQRRWNRSSQASIGHKLAYLESPRYKKILYYTILYYTGTVYNKYPCPPTEPSSTTAHFPQPTFRPSPAVVQPERRE